MGWDFTIDRCVCEHKHIWVCMSMHMRLLVCACIYGHVSACVSVCVFVCSYLHRSECGVCSVWGVYGLCSCMGCVSEWCIYNVCECVWVLDCQGQTGSGSGLNPLHLPGPSLLAALLVRAPRCLQRACLPLSGTWGSARCPLPVAGDPPFPTQAGLQDESQSLPFFLLVTSRNTRRNL